MRLLIISVFSAVLSLVSCAGLNELFTWTRIDYSWANSGQNLKRQTKIEPRYQSSNPKIVFEQTGAESAGSKEPDTAEDSFTPESTSYQYENNIPMGANVWQNKLFISVPRRRLGVPSTLNYVPLNSPNKHNVPLIPYPNWTINNKPDPSNSFVNFVSVYRVAVDQCDRLWFVDTGIIELPGNRTQVKPTTLYIIDLQTDQVIHHHEFPPDQLTPTTSLPSVTVDVDKEACRDAFAYIPDLAGYGLLVYSLNHQKSWRVIHNYFHLEPLAGEFFVSGHNFQWSDGVFSVELTDRNQDGFRDLYFHSMAGTHMYKVSTKILRNATMATRSYHSDDFEVIGDRGAHSQTSAADLHKPTGVLFLGLVNQNALGCWNSHRPLNTISVIQRNDQKMIYPCDVKVYNDDVYLLTNTMPEFLYGKLNYDQINFRIWTNSVEGAIQDTACLKT